MHVWLLNLQIAKCGVQGDSYHFYIIPDEYPYWENYLTHLDIMDKIFAPVTSKERVDYVAMQLKTSWRTLIFCS